MKLAQRAVARKSKARKTRLKGIVANLRDKLSKISLRRSSAPHETPKQHDWIILYVVAGLCIFGLLMIYSGSFYVASQRANTIFTPNNPYHFFILQAAWLVVGSVAGFIFYKLPLGTIKALALPALLTIGILLLIVLAIPGEINGAKLWIKIGPFSLQPSEFAKPFLLVYIAGLLAKINTKDLKELESYAKHSLLPFLLVVLPIVGLIFLGKDLATAGLVGAMCLGVYFFAVNSRLHHIITIGLVAIAIVAGIGFSLSEQYRVNRVNTYIQFLETGEVQDPTDTGYQLRQILIAVGTGGFNGFGFGQSKQKYFYLQETAFSDTIFAIVAEEFGFLGSILVILAYVILIFRALKIAQNAPNAFSSLLALGIGIWFFLQTVIHLGVNVGLIPLTGMTIPFLSYGGSSLLASLIGVGLLLNISKKVKLD